MDLNLNLEFMPGFSFCGTRPGNKLKRKKFSLSFTGVFVDGRKTMISKGFECYYDWTLIMNLILDAFEDSKALEDLEKIEEDIFKRLVDWFLTYPGWGLMSSLWHSKIQQKFTRLLQLAKRTRDMIALGDACTDETCWKKVISAYDSENNRFFIISVLLKNQIRKM